MPAVPLPKSIIGVTDTPRLRESLTNLYFDGQSILKTPGNTTLGTGEGNCRGSITFLEVAHQVSGDKLISIAEDGTTTILGTVEGTADVVMATSFIALNIVVKGGKGYSLSNLGVFVEITDVNFISSVDVTQINQRFVYVPVDGSPLIYTDPNAPTLFPGLNKFDAELLPDQNKGCINVKNDLYIGGAESFEIFRDTGNVVNTFARRDGAAVETGYLAARARYKDTFVFLGRDREGAFAFHAMGTGDAPKISNAAIEEILNSEYSVTELEACTSQRFTHIGTDMVCFRLARHSFLFSDSGWSFMQSGITGVSLVAPWDVNYMSFAYGKYVTGHARDNSIGILDNGTQEFGEDIERSILTFVRSDSNSYFSIDNIYLACLTGSAPTEGSVSMEVTPDGDVFGPRVFRLLGKQGKREQMVAWLGGAGIFERFAGLRIRTTADVDFSIEALSINI